MGNEGAKTSAPETEWLTTTSGTISGWMGVAAGLVAAVLGIIGSAPIWVPLGLAIALVCWLILLRPRVGIEPHDLILRGTFSTARIPLASVRTIVIRQMLVVNVGERRFTNPSIGRPLREVRVRPGESPRANPGVDHIEALIQSHVSEARSMAAKRAERGAAPTGPTEVRIERAWPEIGAAVFLALAILVLALT
jgi:hypothetical protein